MAFDGTLKFDTAIDKTGFKLGLDSIGSIAKMGMGAVTAAIGAATAGISALGAKAIESGKSFESGMSQIQATLGFSIADVANNVNGASETMEKLSQKAEEMGRKTAFSATHAAEGLNILAMSGYDAESSIGMIENVLSMASAGGLQLSQAASYVAGSMKGFTKEAEKFADVTEASAYYADVIAKGATMAATNVGQLGEALSQASATANTYGQTAQATEVALLRLAEQNETGSAAATALAAAMKNLYSPTDTAKKVLDDLGVSAYDAQGKARDFNEIVGELYNALQQIDDEGERNNLENVIFGIQGQAAFDKMVATSAEKVQSFYDGLEYTADGAKGSAAKQAEAMLDNLEGDITLLQSAAEGLYNSLYKSMNGTLRELVQLANGYVTELTEAFTEGGFEGLAQKAGDVLGNAVTKISSYLPKIVKIGTSLVSSLLKGLSENAGNIAKTGIQIALELIKGIGHILAEIPDFATELVQTLADSFSQNQAQIQVTLKTILNLLARSLTENIQPFADAVLMLVSTIGEIILFNLPVLTDAGFRILETLAQALIDNLDTIIQAGFQLIQALSGALLNGDNLEKLLDVGKQLLDFVLNGLHENFPAIRSAIAELIGKMVDYFKEHHSEMLDNGAELVKNVATGLKNAVTVILGETVLLLEAIGKEFDEFGWLTIGAEIVGKIGEGIKSMYDSAVEYTTDLIEKIVNAIKETDWIKLGKDICDGILSGLVGFDADFYDYLDGFGENFVLGIKDIFGIRSPSKLMRDEVGKYLALGIGEGFSANVPDVGEDALNAFRLQSATGFGAVRSSPTSEITNNYTYYNSTQNTDGSRSQGGDIIIPFYLEGEQIQSAVITALQIENLRSGGGFV